MTASCSVSSKTSTSAQARVRACRATPSAAAPASSNAASSCRALWTAASASAMAAPMLSSSLRLALSRTRQASLPTGVKRNATPALGFPPAMPAFAVALAPPSSYCASSFSSRTGAQAARPSWASASCTASRSAWRARVSPWLALGTSKGTSGHAPSTGTGGVTPRAASAANCVATVACASSRSSSARRACRRASRRNGGSAGGRVPRS